MVSKKHNQREQVMKDIRTLEHQIENVKSREPFSDMDADLLEDLQCELASLWYMMEKGDFDCYEQ